MSRIEEALRRAEASGNTPSVPAPAADGDPFVSPWQFDDGEAGNRPRPALLPAQTETIPAGAGELSVFRGFNPAVLDLLVVGPTANSIMTEQFRRLAATLHHAQIVQGTRTIMMTSALAGDGKSLSATNLALTLSESYQRRVLLIDADLRRPTLHEIFQVPNVEGLNEGLASARDGKLAVVQISKYLTLLPAGHPNPDPMSGLTSQRMREVIQEAADRFDWVIIDTAPVGLLADASLVVTMTDGVLFVIRAGQTPYELVAKSVELLGRERIIGVVFNGVETGGQDISYYRGYSSSPDKS